VVARADEPKDMAPERLPAVGQHRMLEWADPDARVTASVHPAFRLLDMQAPAFSGEMRLVAFSAMWRSAMDELTQALVRRFAMNHAVGVATAVGRR
jgi:hypothetical protein